MLRPLYMCVLVAPLLWACSGGAPVGAVCSQSSDCAAELQCFAGSCAPLCQHHVDCGDGFVCEASGECRLVESAIGDACARARDCGPGQRCQLEAVDGDGDGRLAATCQAELGAGVPGAACAADDGCRSGTCVLGVCTELCERTSDCAPDLSCAAVPRLEADGALFSGCLPASGVLTTTIEAGGPSVEFAIPVPGHARSFAIVSRVASAAQLVGVRELRGPDDAIWHREGDAASRLIVHEAQPGVSTLLVPNTDRVELSTGVYRGRIEVTTPDGQPGTLVPQVEVHYKLGDEKRLDLELVFLDLADHPCRAAWGGGELSSATAPGIPALQHDFLGGIAEIFAGADIALGPVRYRDLARADLDALPRERIGELLSLSTAESGVTVFVVRSLAPVGVQALSGGTPGPPRTPGTRASGIVLSADTLCYRSWRDLARTAAHTLASQMGLYPNRGPDGEPDPIADSDDSVDNLMYFGEFGGAQLSEGQRRVLGHYPGLR